MTKVVKALKNIIQHKQSGKLIGSPSLKHVPTIAICSHDRINDRFKVKMFGANDCIAKPSISTEIVALVNKHTSHLVVNTSQINHKDRGKDREISTRISELLCCDLILARLSSR